MKRFVGLGMLLLAILACNLEAQPEPKPKSGVETVVAATIQAQQAQPPSHKKPTLTSTQAAVPPPPTDAPPQESPTATLSPTPSVPVVSVSKDTNCRSGPGKDYDILGILNTSEQAEVVGKYPPADSWIIQNPDHAGTCWLWGQYAQVSGNTDDLPVMQPPSTPTPTFTLTPEDAVPPTIENVSALEATVCYPDTCGTDQLSIKANINDPSGIDDAYVKYRFLEDGSDYVGPWHTAPVHDHASGGLHGFIIDVAADAAAELGTDNGVIEYQVFAEDGFGNLGHFPADHVLGVPIEHCP
ncbi:MAG: hypothetical protein U9Q82_02815 [Chloroflexota bacterium]|nr:hypothetical protein [Chloroflexota bacterium]